MLRLTLILCCAALLATSAVAECQLRSAWRGDSVTTYVPSAQSCLDNPRSEIWFDEDVEAAVFDLINAERRAAGLTPLKLRRGLIAPARIHSFDMAQEGFFDHNGLDGRNVEGRVGALDRRLVRSEMRENIASIGGDINYQSTAKLLHGQLMRSEGHKANILAPNITHMAIGLARKPKGAWITQIFVRQEGEFAVDVPLSGSLNLIDVSHVHLDDWEVAEIRAKPQSEEAPLTVSQDDISIEVIGTKLINETQRGIIQLGGPLISNSTP